MRLKVLGSSSVGNCYLLEAADGETLAIEAGVRLSEVKKALRFKMERLAGCLISHEHGDHASQAVRFGRFTDLYMSRGTAEAKHIDNAYFTHVLHPMERVRIGGFEVMSFPVQHDAKEPFGYLIKHPECGTIVFATDTYYLKYRFDGVANWMIECNYRMDILEWNCHAGRIDERRRDRTLKSHMSYETLLDTLKANDLRRTNNIVLLHLSEDNSDATAFVGGVQAATGKNVVAAKKGLIMDFNKTPY